MDPELSPRLTSGVVGIMFIGEDLYPSAPFNVGETYQIVQAMTTDVIPILGAQLRKRWGRGMILCGWVKTAEHEQIMHHLASGKEVVGTVSSREPFKWKDVQCYWGELEWSVKVAGV